MSMQERMSDPPDGIVFRVVVEVDCPLLPEQDAADGIAHDDGIMGEFDELQSSNQVVRSVNSRSIRC